MTKEEAIKDIRDAKVTCCPYGYYEALDMAIEALESQDRPIICPRCGRTFSEAEGNPWWIVYKELSKNGLLMGHYDARNGASDHFMYGIGTVMESIAVRCGMQEKWTDEFYKNMAESEERSNQNG